MTNFSHLFSKAGFREKILPEFKALIHDTNWKVRSAMLEQDIPNLRKWEHISDLWDEYFETLMGLKEDHVFYVRTNFVNCLCDLYEEDTRVLL